MADPIIVPPPPTITQPSGPVDTSPGLEQVQKAFDRVFPEIKTSPTPKSSTPPAVAEPPQPAPQPVAPPAEPPKPPQAPPAAEPKPPDETHIPSFLEEALKLEPSQPKPPPVDEEIPEELPLEERKSRIKGLRDAYKNLKQEVQALRERPSLNQEQANRLAYLENQNKQMQDMLTRVGVEHSAEFQSNIIAPLQSSWNEAARIVRDAGGDPNDLAKAMSLSGKAQFEALDTLFAEMPESAKAEAHDALRQYRRFEEARRVAIQNAPKTLEQIRARETERQYAQLSKQKEEMKTMFDRALSKLRDEAKVEVFQKTTDPQAGWWNDQSDRLVEQARNLFLENTDLDRVAMACLLAPAADAYRSLFMKSQKKVSELQKIIKDRIGNEPTLSESPGNAASPTPDSQFKDDLKKPFQEVFLREFHRAQARSR